MSNEILLYGTLGCHLCTEAEAWLDTLYPTVTVHKVDIADDEALVARYGVRIPVLANGQQEHDWPFEERAVQALMVQTQVSVSAYSKTPSTSERRIWRIGASKE